MFCDSCVDFTVAIITSAAVAVATVAAVSAVVVGIAVAVVLVAALVVVKKPPLRRPSFCHYSCAPGYAG